MKAFLTSSLGGSFKVNGRRIPQVLIEKNGLLARLKEMWPKNAKILLFCGSPNGYEKNDAVYGCLRFPVLPAVIPELVTPRIKTNQTATEKPDDNY